MEDNRQRTDKKPGGPADHLANERTFLAWIRTSIALMGFGFVIVKFALFLQEMSLAFGNTGVISSKGYSSFIGVVMVALGAIIAVLAFLRYKTVERQLKEGLFFTSIWMSVSIMVTIVIGAVLLVIYLLPSIKAG